MEIIKFAESLGISLSYYQKELLTILAVNGNSYVKCVHSPSQSLLTVHEIYKKYNEVRVAS